MKIFKPTKLPPTIKKKMVWDYTQGWAIRLDDGTRLYGFRTREDIEAALKPQKAVWFKKKLYDDLDAELTL
jgi:hypothetical protein